MKSLVIILSVLVFIVAANALSLNALERCTDTLLNALTQAETACLHEQWKQAEQWMEHFDAQWTQAEFLLKTLIDHSETDAVAVLKGRVVAGIRQEDDAVLGDMAELTLLIAQIPEHFHLSWINLL